MLKVAATTAGTTLAPKLGVSSVAPSGSIIVTLKIFHSIFEVERKAHLQDHLHLHLHQIQKGWLLMNRVNMSRLWMGLYVGVSWPAPMIVVKLKDPFEGGL